MSLSIDASTSLRLVLVLGGARSGKSAFAERLAASSGRRIAFIATATASDEDMRQRIARHRASRSPEWLTIEEPLHLAGALRRASTDADVLLLDCITLWLANWMGQQGRLELDDAPALQAAGADRLLADRPPGVPPPAGLRPQRVQLGAGVVPDQEEGASGLDPAQVQASVDAFLGWQSFSRMIRDSARVVTL